MAGCRTIKTFGGWPSIPPSSITGSIPGNRGCLSTGNPKGAGDFAGGRVDLNSTPETFDSGGTALTLEVWAQPDAAPTYRWMIAKDNGNAAIDYLLGQGDQGHWVFFSQGLGTLTGGAGHYLLDPNEPVVDGQTWTHVVGVQDPANQRVLLYVNGVEVASTELLTTGVTSTLPLRLGDRSDAGVAANLQSADQVLGPWADHTGITSPYVVNPTSAQACYRLRQ